MFSWSRWEVRGHLPQHGLLKGAAGHGVVPRWARIAFLCVEAKVKDQEMGEIKAEVFQTLAEP